MMGKTWLIISREFYTRVRKPSFIVLTILGPILMAALFIGPIYLQAKSERKYNVAIVDSSGLADSLAFHDVKGFMKYNYYPDKTAAKKDLMTGKIDLVLFIPKDILKPQPEIRFYFKSQPGFIATERIKSDVVNMRDLVQYDQNGIDVEKMNKLHLGGSLKVYNKQLDDDGNEKNTNLGVSMGIGLAGGMVMYVFIIIYGIQVMRGVMEEKTNRIVEVIVSSVRPFQLMMGKIVGIAMVGLTQFLLWIVLTAVLVSVGQQTLLKDVMKKKDVTDQQNDPFRQMKQGENYADYLAAQQQAAHQKERNRGDIDVADIVSDLTGRNLSVLIGIFLFYFLGGYLLYSSLFAAAGSAVDSETDSQQFILPITAPVIFSIAVSGAILNNPDGALAVTLSLIPFTSPVVMMIRVPFMDPGWQLYLSMLLLVVGFVFTTWLAGRIYRTGILMYGKKSSWRELGKWLFYRG